MMCGIGSCLRRVKNGLKLDVRELGGHLHTTGEGLHALWACPLGYLSSCLDLCTTAGLSWACSDCQDYVFILCALHGDEASALSKGSFLKLRAAILRAVWSRRQPLACAGAVLGVRDGPQKCDSSCCLVWYKFRLFRRYLAFRPDEVAPVYRLQELVQVAVLVMVLFTLWLLLQSGLDLSGAPPYLAARHLHVPFHLRRRRRGTLVVRVVLGT